MRIFTPALLVALCAGGAAMADPWDCHFSVECQAGDGCAQTGLSLRVIAADHAGDLFLSSVAGDSAVMRLTEPGILPASYAGAGRDGVAELLTIEADRTALMTLHSFDGTTAAITYFGTCEEMS
jgi:hypothetical protein